jgi:hypothetical protein
MLVLMMNINTAMVQVGDAKRWQAISRPSTTDSIALMTK